MRRFGGPTLSLSVSERSIECRVSPRNYVSKRSGRVGRAGILLMGVGPPVAINSRVRLGRAQRMVRWKAR